MALLYALAVALLPVVAWVILRYSINNYVSSGISETKLTKLKGEPDARGVNFLIALIRSGWWGFIVNLS